MLAVDVILSCGVGAANTLRGGSQSLTTVLFDLHLCWHWQNRRMGSAYWQLTRSCHAALVSQLLGFNSLIFSDGDDYRLLCCWL